MKPGGRKVLAAAAVLGTAIAGGCHLEAIVPSETGASVEDASVTLVATIGKHERVDWKRAARLATQRCRGWGYASAEPTSESEVRCTDNPGGLCGWKNNVFQCDCRTLTVSATYGCIR